MEVAISVREWPNDPFIIHLQMYSKYLDSLIRQKILYKDIQEIHLIINSIMLSIKWSQWVFVV